MKITKLEMLEEILNKALNDAEHNEIKVTDEEYLPHKYEYVIAYLNYSLKSKVTSIKVSVPELDGHSGHDLTVIVTFDNKSEKKIYLKCIYDEKELRKDLVSELYYLEKKDELKESYIKYKKIHEECLEAYRSCEEGRKLWGNEFEYDDDEVIDSEVVGKSGKFGDFIEIV